MSRERKYATTVKVRIFKRSSKSSPEIVVLRLEKELVLKSIPIENVFKIRQRHLIGRNGKSLDDAWAVRPTAFNAVTLPDFPNFFMLNGPTGPASFC